MQAGLIGCLLLALLACRLGTRRCRLCIERGRQHDFPIVDLAQMKTVGTIPVGQRPRGIAVTKDGKHILVCAGDDNTIQIVDAATRDIVGTLPSGPDPETFALSPAGDLLYIANDSMRW